jgi:hypothetical protein
MDHNITTLVKELAVIAASISSRVGGGNHGHAGIIVEATKYIAEVPFIDPIHPGIYPTGLATKAAAGTRAKAEAEHKESLASMKSSKESNKNLKTSS